MRVDNVNRLIKICLDIANIADEKQETPFDKEMGLGYRAFTGYIRAGVNEIIDLQDKRYSFEERMKRAEEDNKDVRDFLNELFGDREPDTLNEADKAKIKAVCDEIRASWEGE